MFDNKISFDGARNPPAIGLLFTEQVVVFRMPDYQPTSVDHLQIIISKLWSAEVIFVEVSVIIRYAAFNT